MPTRTRLFSTLTALIAGALVLVAPSGALRAAPEPSPVPTSWEFTFEPGPLRLAWVDTEQGASPFFYFTFKVTNFWGNDLLFAPSVELVTSDSEVLVSNRDVPLAVTAEILRRLDNPLMLSQTDLVDTVLNGPEHAREGVLIWPATDLDVDEISIFFAGLSGERENYIAGRDGPDPKRYSLRKTMMLRYATPGDFGRQGSRPFEVVEKRWIMR
jgi:hypothetical protein